MTLFFLLSLFTNVMNPTGLFFGYIAWLNDLDLYLHVENKYMMPRWKAKMKPQEWNAFYARYLTYQESMKRYAQWASPILMIDTEQVNQVGIRFKLPVNHVNVLWWIEPSIQEIAIPVFLEPIVGANYSIMDSLIFPHKRRAHMFWGERHRSFQSSSVGSYHEEPFIRWSVGSGFRWRLSPQWTIGGYSYYDFSRHSSYGCSIDRARNVVGPAIPVRRCYEYHQHTINGGVEVFTPIGKVASNVYLHRVNIKRPRLLDIASPLWGSDIKISPQWGPVSCGIGAYYHQWTIKGIEPSSHKNPVDQYKWPSYPFNVFGWVGELKYAHQDRMHVGFGERIYGIKYTWDAINQHRLSLTFEFKPFQTGNQPLLEQSVERYLGPSKFNAKGSAWLRDKADSLYYKNVTDVRAFCEDFAQQMSHDENRLTTQERNILGGALSDFSAIPTYVPFKKISTQLLLGEDYRTTEGYFKTNIKEFYQPTQLPSTIGQPGARLNLSDLQTARSLTQNALWLGSLKEPSIGITLRGNDLADISTSLTQRKLEEVKTFFDNNTHYFSSIQSSLFKPSLKLEDFREGRYSPAFQIGKESILFHVDHMESLFPAMSLGDRLILLERIIQECLPGYQRAIIGRTDVSTQEELQALNHKLHHLINSNLSRQWTALMLTDLHPKMRRMLSSFTYLPIPDKVLKDPDGAGPWIDGLQKLPGELRLMILEEVLKGEVDWGMQRNRFKLFQYDINSLEDWYKLYTGGLLHYLSNIHTSQQMQKYWGMPYNAFKILV